jgi:pheromone receptor transcription factor
MYSTLGDSGVMASSSVSGRWETKETKALVAAEWARVADVMEKVRAAQASAGKRNWWEVDVDALGEEELPVFIWVLEMLRADVQDHVDAIASARLPLPWMEKKLQ